MEKKIKKVCEFCRKQYLAKTKRSRFCTDKHRIYSFRGVKFKK